MSQMKIVLLGNKGVGKSCLRHKFCDTKFNVEKTDVTIGVEFGNRTIQVSEKNIKCQIWDSAGDERHQTITASFFNETSVILLCCDLTKPESLTQLKTVLEKVKASSHTMKPHCVFGLVGTKSDLVGEIKVSDDDLKRFATEHHLDFYIMCSAKLNANIQYVFVEAVKLACNKEVRLAREKADKVSRAKLANMNPPHDLEEWQPPQPTVKDLLEMYKWFGGGKLAAAKIFGFFRITHSFEDVVHLLRERCKNKTVGASYETLNHFKL